MSPTVNWLTKNTGGGTLCEFCSGYNVNNNNNIIETAGAWHSMAIELTRKIVRRITIVTEDTKETTYSFVRLYALQKGNAVFFYSMSNTPLQLFTLSYFQYLMSAVVQ